MCRNNENDIQQEQKISKLVYTSRNKICLTDDLNNKSIDTNRA